MPGRTAEIVFFAQRGMVRRSDRADGQMWQSNVKA